MAERNENVAPAVAVIVPAFNEQKSIESCLRTILQCKPPEGGFEIIAVDDGSTDRTAEIVRSVAAQDHRVKLVQQSNRGKGSAQNTGVRATRATQILVTDADTLVPSDWMVRLVPRLSECALIQAGCLPSSQDNTILKFQTAHCMARFSLPGAWSFPSVGANNAFRRSVWEAVGGFSETTRSPTSEFRQRVEALGQRVQFLPEPSVRTYYPNTLRGYVIQRLRWREGTTLTKEQGGAWYIRFLYVMGIDVAVFFLVPLLVLIGTPFLAISAAIAPLVVDEVVYLPAMLRMRRAGFGRESRWLVGYPVLQLLVRWLHTPYMLTRLFRPSTGATFKPDRWEHA